MGRSDRALRRMVSRLPSMKKADFDAIMKTLSDEHRAKVIILLEELEGSQSKVDALDETTLRNPLITVPDNLSPWLVARVNGNPAAAAEMIEQFSMTAHAQASLRLCAAELVPQPTKSARPSLFGQLWMHLVGHRFET